MEMSCITRTSTPATTPACARPGSQTPDCESPRRPSPPPLPAANLAQFIAGNWHTPCTYINWRGEMCGSLTGDNRHFTRNHFLPEASTWHSVDYNQSRLPIRSAWILNTPDIAKAAKHYLTPCTKIGCEQRFSRKASARRHLDTVHRDDKDLPALKKRLEEMKRREPSRFLRYLRRRAEQGTNA
jgi:hypothetical protein